MPLAALFAAFCLLVLAFGGGSRGYGLWLMAGAALGACFVLRSAGRIEALTAQYGGRTVTLTACVEEVQPGYTRSTVRARLRVETADGAPAAFCCQCDGLPLCEAGEKIEGAFTLEAPDPADRPGRYADEVVFLAGYERRFSRLGEGTTFRARSARWQSALSDALCQDIGGDAAGALAAMIVGDRTRISSELNGAYRAAGLSHVLVVSGMHVTILCGALSPRLWDRRRWLESGHKLAGHLAQKLPGRLWQKLYRRLGLTLVLDQMAPPRPAVGGVHPGAVWARRALALWPVCLAALLAGITGMTPSVLRAGAAVAVGAAGVWVMAPADSLTSLAAAGLVMSAFNGYAVCDIGFELSFAAVAGTVAGVELVSRRREKRRRKQENAPHLRRSPARRGWDAIRDAVWENGCVSVCASAATFPVLVLRGLSTSPYALLSGVAVLWMVNPMMILGIAAALAGLVPALRPVYAVCAFGAAALVRLLNAWARMVAGWPAAQLAFDTGYAAAVSLALMALCLLAYRWRVRARVFLPALALAAAVGVGAGFALGRGVVQVALVGGARTPSVILAQDGQAAVLYRGGSSGRAAVEQWLARHGMGEPELLIDLRSGPGADPPAAGRVITAARLGDYSTWRGSCGSVEIEVLCLPGGSAARLTVDRWQLAAVSGTFELAGPVAVDWLLASPADPSAFRWQGVLALGSYGWMGAHTDETPPSGLLLRPGGGVRTR